MEHAIDEFASDQHRVITHEQLIDIGLSQSAINRRVACKRLHRIHRGVFVVGPLPLAAHGLRMAAVLACGEGAMLSHRSAAALWGLRPDNRATIDVTTPRAGTRSRHNVVIHRSRTLTAADIDTVDGIRCTSLARTLLDLAEILDRRGLERAIDRAEQLRILDMNAINDVLARAKGRRGAKLLRWVLDEHYAGSTLTRRKLEELMLAICRTAGLPRPRVNEWIALPNNTGYEGDFVWPQQRLIVETDGYETHGTRHAFEHDRKRDQRLMLAGWRVIRFTRRQVLNDPHSLAAALTRLLARAA